MNLNTQPIIGIIGAMDEEVAILKEQMSIIETSTIAGITFYQGTLHDKSVVLARSGIGKVNASICAQLMITTFNATHLINSGVAGTLNPLINQGDIVISSDAVQHDFDTTAIGDPLGEIARLGITFFKANADLINFSDQAIKNIQLENVNVFHGRIASGDQFVAGGPMQERIQSHFAPSAVEMEGAAIAHVAHLNNTPFVIIRAISDKADGGADLSYTEFLPIAAYNVSHVVSEIVRIFAEN
ncbi:MAG: 5'-methylthioadenosine/adenosylhomocysteine nucleosidase [Cellulosilyticaceae bacterium]